MDIVQFKDFPQDERTAFDQACKELRQDVNNFHVTAEETPADGIIPRKRAIVIIDRRDAHPIRIECRIIQGDWVAAWQRAFKARMK